jgi:hypothetical protein
MVKSFVANVSRPHLPKRSGGQVCRFLYHVINYQLGLKAKPKGVNKIK